MTCFLVSGLINFETTLRVPAFPLQYNPVNYPMFGIQSSVSGVGYNVSKALTALEDSVFFLSIIGHDYAGQRALDCLRQENIAANYVVAQASQTAQSVILYDGEGNRQIHTDLKDIQDKVYPARRFEQVLPRCDFLVLCNINFSRPMLARAKQAGKPVATDVHAISELEDDYNRDFMQAADVLFMSHERLPAPPQEFAQEVMRCYQPKVLVISLGSGGSLLLVKDQPEAVIVPAVDTRPVVSTVGAGDALFSAFLHSYAQGEEPLDALRKATVFASYKLGFVSAADGFLNDYDLNALYREVYSRQMGNSAAQS